MSQRQFDPIARQPARPSREDASDRRPQHAETHPLLGLQQTIGNAQVARLVAQRAMAEQDEEELQMKRDVGAEGGSLSEGAAGQLQALRGGGHPLDAALRSRMEAAMGTSFGDVRVHTGTQADTLNRGMGARAFTSGSDVVLRNDQSAADTHLLAHELTHVVQQRSMASDAGSGIQVRPAGDSYEQAADATADRLQSDGLV
jgi:hypothetical protein